MPLRLLEVTVPADAVDRVNDMLKDTPAADVLMEQAGNGTALFRILVPAQSTEALTDLLAAEFEDTESFRIVLLAVEAVLPALDETAEEGENVGGAEESRGPRRIGRDELYEDIAHAAQLTWVYVAMVALSTVVAAVGLIRSDVAVIIGAMVIAPLLGPNVALALACTLGDVKLARRSLRAIGAGVGTAFLVAFGLGAALEVDPSTPEILSRTGARMGDVFLALAAGTAGSLSFTSGVPAVLVGVMVAVALLPPLVAAGLLAGSGHGTAALGATALVVTNVACVNLAAVATFLVQRVRPRTWWEEDRARTATRIAVATWLLMIGVLVALIGFDVVSISTP